MQLNFLAGPNLFGGMWDVQVQLLSIFLTTLIICIISIIYNVKIRNHKVGEHLSGFLVLIEMYVGSIENMVVSIMGKKYRKLTPYALYLISYIVVSSMTSLIGIESAMTSYTVTLSMGFVTFIFIYYFGFKYQKLAYLKRYINPIELITQFTPLISISFRLFGNLLGGAIIMGLVYALGIGMQASWGGGDIDVIWDPHNPGYWKAQQDYFWSGFNILTTLFTPFFHLYFDMFDSVIQSIVFTMLTLSYWSEAMGEHGESSDIERNVIETDKKLFKTKQEKTQVVSI
ncbi:F0F1 ATP synthase subunit A [Williamsoniiplasma lucivorax]|uniref:F0F1 ATP synthase subunit A n=1 Tax=Williamsoniiplasma lucivorax TaxID=209274 RepID=A0A2S5REV1_9MOLU|nr:F0F1 ATP synthase subunit A [Williamsoniiplasma lucivorax]PPE05841.1 F0F1 ATP synthase subunit A [Williamsoniiplasma lucivorax]